MPCGKTRRIKYFRLLLPLKKWKPLPTTMPFTRMFIRVVVPKKAEPERHTKIDLMLLNKIEVNGLLLKFLDLEGF